MASYAFRILNVFAEAPLAGNPLAVFEDARGIDGKKAATLRGPTLTADFKQMVTDYIERRFGTGARAAE